MNMDMESYEKKREEHNTDVGRQLFLLSFAISTRSDNLCRQYTIPRMTDEDTLTFIIRFTDMHPMHGKYQGVSISRPYKSICYEWWFVGLDGEVLDVHEPDFFGDMNELTVLMRRWAKSV